MSIRQSSFLIWITTVVTALWFSSCNFSSSDYHHCEGSVWTTTYHITYKSHKALDDSIFSIFAKVDSILSPFAPNSVISRINRNETSTADSLVRHIFRQSQKFNHISHGAFDPTVAPLVNLWGFGYTEADSIVLSSKIDSVLNFVGIDRCQLHGDSIIKPVPETQFNFSAITKGYACDLIGQMLLRNGCTDYMVEIGGEIALSGHNRQNSPWHVMVEAPIENDTAINRQSMEIIAVTDCGIATSGNYRNFRMSNLGRVWHTINARTGYPAVTTTLSATVIAHDAMSADALATACMVLPADSAIAMIEQIPNTEVLLITGTPSGYKTNCSSNFPTPIN